MKDFFWQALASRAKRDYCQPHTMHIIYPKRLRYPHKAANHLQATAMACALGRLLPVHMYASMGQDAEQEVAATNAESVSHNTNAALGTLTSPPKDIAAYIEAEYHFAVPPGLHIHTIPFQNLSLYNLALDSAAGWALLGKGAVAYTRDVRRGGFCAQVQSLSPRKFPIIHEVHDFRDEAVLGRVLHRAAGVIFIHEQLRQETAERFGYTGPSCIAQSGFDGALFHPKHEGFRAPKPEEPFILAYVGTIREDKGVDLLLEMMRLLPERIHLKLVGVPAFRSQETYERLLTAIPDSARRIIVTGHVPHHKVAAELRTADAMLLPPVPAGKYLSQIKVFEALGCGLPIIAAPLPHLTDFLTHGQTAFFAADASAKAMAEAAKVLSESPALLESIHNDSLRLSKEYTWDARAACIKDFMEDVTGLKAAAQHSA